MKRLLLICLLLCVGCTTTSDKMKSWVGKSESELLSKWGSPDSYIKLENGGKVFTWSYYWDAGKCRRTFTINPEGYVEKYSFSNCPLLVRK